MNISECIAREIEEVRKSPSLPILVRVELKEIKELVSYAENTCSECPDGKCDDCIVHKYSEAIKQIS